VPGSWPQLKENVGKAPDLAWSLGIDIPVSAMFHADYEPVPWMPA
jgi:hypothetical protein